MQIDEAAELCVPQPLESADCRLPSLLAFGTLVAFAVVSVKVEMAEL